MLGLIVILVGLVATLVALGYSLLTAEQLRKLSRMYQAARKEIAEYARLLSEFHDLESRFWQISMQPDERNQQWKQIERTLLTGSDSQPDRCKRAIEQLRSILRQHNVKV